jgi:hypothetical protein
MKEILIFHHLHALPCTNEYDCLTKVYDGTLGDRPDIQLRTGIVTTPDIFHELGKKKLNKWIG